MSTSYLSTTPALTDAAGVLPPAQMSAEAYIAWVLASNIKAEWVEGEVVVMSPANWEHTSLRRWLDSLMTDFAEERGLGTVADDTLVRLKQGRRFRIPDIFFVAAERTAIIHPTMLIEPPDMVIEIVSPDSAARDWREKYLEYQECGIREYWVIDPTAGSFEVYALDSTGQYQPNPVTDGIVRSTVLTGFWLRTIWLAETNRPMKKIALRELLSGKD